MTHRHLLRTMGRGLEALARSAAAAAVASAADTEAFTTSQRRRRLLRSLMDLPRVLVLMGAAATVAAELVRIVALISISSQSAMKKLLKEAVSDFSPSTGYTPGEGIRQAPRTAP